MGSELQKVPSYLSGFKKRINTLSNNTKLVLSIIRTRRAHFKRNSYILVDLRKAYDSIYKEKLVKILRYRCEKDQEKRMVSLIALFHVVNQIKYGGSKINALRGVV